MLKTIFNVVSDSPTNSEALDSATLVISPLSHLEALKADGADHLSFLQGQLTQDVAQIAKGESTLGGYCTPKGRLLALMRMYQVNDTLIMLLSADTLAPVHKRLNMFKMRAKATIEAADVKLIGISGSEAAGYLTGLIGEIPTGYPDIAHGAGWSLLAYPEQRWLLVLEPNSELANQALPENVAIGNSAYWRLRDIRDGLPLLSGAVAEEFVPQMVNLDNLGGISFKKGCYAGQEIVARTHYLGELKRKMLFGSTSDKSLKAGDSLSTEDGKSIGTVVDAVDGNLLAVVRTDKLTQAPLTPSKEPVSMQP